MATVVNDPDNKDSTPAPGTSGPLTRPDATPTSGNGTEYNAPTVTKSAGPGGTTIVKVTGSDENDRISTKDLIRDTDKVIGTGAGDDVFIFRQDDATNSSLRNAVVDLGANKIDKNGVLHEGGFDTVVLANELNDYQITFRDNGSIKFEYIGNGSTNNAAITFVGADQFTFRNVSEADGTAYKSTTYSIDELREVFGLGPQPNADYHHNL